MELIRFIFSSFWYFIGFLMLFIVACQTVISVVVGIAAAFSRKRKQ